MKVLLITEKPKVARKIAEVLGANKQKTSRNGDVTYYTLKFGGDDITVVPASGHLLSIDFPDEYNKRWDYPVVVPVDNLELKAINARSKKFVSTIRQLSKGIDVIVSACDLDTEGSAIAYEIIKHLKLEKRKLMRMEYSSLTSEAILASYAGLKDFDWGRSYAGFTRGIQDLEWGANITRALTLSSRSAGSNRKVLSGGRVQSPTLALIVDRENEIRKFDKKKFFVIEGTFSFKGETFKATYTEKLEDKAEAKAIAADCQNIGKGPCDVKETKKSVGPPPPFNGTDLQVEASKVLNISPEQIADRRKGIAQGLYEKGLISYPGTDSQKYPGTWKPADHTKMIKVPEPMMGADVQWVLDNRRPKPLEGKKDDPAHPCIHVTEYGNFETEKHRKVYELIARRGLATHSPNSKEALKKVVISMEKYPFQANGKTILDQGWRTVYPYHKVEENELPDVKTGSEVELVSIEVQEKETKPPARYSETSLISALDKLGIGTKNTRPNIINKLFERQFISGKKIIKPTDLGERVIVVLRGHAKKIADPKFTSELEHRMEALISDPSKFNDENQKSLKELSGIMSAFKKQHYEIGRELIDGLEEPTAKGRGKGGRKGSDGGNGEWSKPSGDPELGKCVACNSLLREMDGKYGKFVGCTGYPDCKKTYQLVVDDKGKKTVVPNEAKGGPKPGGDEKLGKCEACGSLLREIEGKFGKFVGCTSYPKCKKTYQLVVDDKGKKTVVPNDAKGAGGGNSQKPEGDPALGKCRACGSLLREMDGRYGKFVGCTGYPKCKKTYQLRNGEKLLKSKCKCGMAFVTGKVKSRDESSEAYKRCLGNCPDSPIKCTACGAVPSVLESKIGIFVKCACGAMNSFKVLK